MMGVLELETGYKNPLNFKYNPNQSSYANAHGAAQIQLPTGKFISGNKNLTKNDLLYNNELNIKLSAKYLNYLYKQKHNWKLALGFYNSGYWIVNSYSERVYKKFLARKT